MIQVAYSCSASMNTIIGAIKFVLNIIRWAIPVVLIILGSIDMFKAMASNDDKKAGEAKSTFIRRLIYALVAFLIPFLVTLAFDMAGQIIKDNDNLNNDNLKNGNFFECWYKGGSSSNRSSDGSTCTCKYNCDSNNKNCDVAYDIPVEDCSDYDQYDGRCDD